MELLVRMSCVALAWHEVEADQRPWMLLGKAGNCRPGIGAAIGAGGLGAGCCSIPPVTPPGSVTLPPGVAGQVVYCCACAALAAAAIVRTASAARETEACMATLI